MAIDTALKRFSMMGMVTSALRTRRLGPPSGSNADSAGQRQMLLGLYSGIAAEGITYTLAGMPFHWATANRPTNVAPYLEVFFKAITGTVYARLLDVTAEPAAAVAASEISTSATSLIRKRHSSSLTFTDDHEYMLQLGKQGADGGEIEGARVVVIYP